MARRPELRDRVGASRSASLRIPKELHGEEREAVEKLIERLEEDDDVVNVYTAMKDEAEEE